MIKSMKPSDVGSQKRLRFHLPYLHCFWTVARLQSFTKAAQELNISQSAVSYQIAKLESSLGSELIYRTKGSAFKLSREGEILLKQCGTIFSQLEQTFGELSNTSVSGRLNVAAPTCFGSLFLSKVVASLAQSTPDLKVSLNLSDIHVDMRRSQIDLAIRTMTSGQDISIVPLLKTSMAFIAAPELLARASPIRKLEDLATTKMILSGPDNADWQNLLQLMPQVSEIPIDFVNIDNVWGILHAVLGGLGIAYLPRYAVVKELQEGSLHEVLPELKPQIPLTLCLSTQSDVGHDRRIQAFLAELYSLLATPTNAALFEKVGPLWDRVIK